MRRYRTVLACSLSALALAGACIPALATPYNDSGVTGGSEAWNQWVQEWETVATDYTKVSLTPGEQDHELLEPAEDVVVPAAYLPRLTQVVFEGEVESHV